MNKIAYIDEEPVPDYLSQNRLDGRVHVVFGAGRGIGRQCAHALRQAGARVVCVDNEEVRGKAVAEEVDGTFIQADMTVPNEAAAVFEAVIRDHGRLYGIVDIIGASFGARFLDADPELVRRNFDLNLHQAMDVTQAGAKEMAKTGGGTIVLVGSVSAIAALPNQVIYGTAKAALHHFVRCAAAELGHLGVRLNAVAPGYVRTERMIERFDADYWTEIAHNTPLQRAGQTSDIAAPVLFLSQDVSSFVTGQVLVADGGLLAPIRAMRAPSSRQIAGELMNS
ncbi:MAG: SDR family oxidoreductase [Rhodobacteraceae bacterium]|nr:SDR family oxidoreductase [Paracoccaceae bacterium]MBR9823927.1 SDR family oxidoreductase [Paracoccaceae bacterium]